MTCRAGIRERGLTLVEVLVVLTIFGLVVAGLSTAFTSSQKEYGVRQATMRMQQQARLAMTFLERDLRMTGYGFMDMGNLLINSYDNDGKKLRVLPLVEATSVAGASDSVAVRYYNGDLDAAPEMHLAAACSSSGPAVDTPVSSFSGGFDLEKAVPVGSAYLVYDQNDASKPAALLQATGISGSAIDHKASSKLNPSGSVEIFPAGGYPQRGRVLGLGTDRMRRVRYYLDGGKNLVREQQDNLGAAEARPVASGIEDLQFTFLLKGGKEWKPQVADADIVNLRAIRVSIIARTEKPDPQHASADSLRISGEYGDGPLCSGGGYRRMMLSTTIHLRNLGMRQ